VRTAPRTQASRTRASSSARRCDRARIRMRARTAGALTRRIQAEHARLSVDRRRVHRQHAQQRRLARTVAADERRHAPARNVEVEAVEDRAAAEAHAQTSHAHCCIPVVRAHHAPPARFQPRFRVHAESPKPAGRRESVPAEWASPRAVRRARAARRRALRGTP
jgi:hypothetical protein